MKYTIPFIGTQSIDHHSGGDLALDIGELGRLLLGPYLLILDVGLEAVVEVVDAHARVGNGNHDEDQGDDGEEGHRWPSGDVQVGSCLRVHTEQLEDEVCHSRKEEELEMGGEQAIQ